MKNNNLFLALIATLTLGLAPFTPEPHFFGKVKWLLGGAHGMEAMDWFDLFMHGAPWVWLFIELIRFSVTQLKKAKS